MAQQRRSSLNLSKSRSVVVRAERRSGKEDFGIAVDELHTQLRSRGERRERNDDGADARGGQHPDDERRTVGVEQSDMSALSGAEGDQTAGQLRRPAVGLCVAEALGVADQERVVGPRLCLLPQHVPDGQRFTGHVRRAG